MSGLKVINWYLENIPRERDLKWQQVEGLSRVYKQDRWKSGSAAVHQFTGAFQDTPGIILFPGDRCHEGEEDERPHLGTRTWLLSKTTTAPRDPVVVVNPSKWLIARVKIHRTIIRFSSHILDFLPCTITKSFISHARWARRNENKKKKSPPGTHLFSTTALLNSAPLAPLEFFFHHASEKCSRENNDDFLFGSE